MAFGHKDALGRPVEVGDVVFYAKPESRSAGLRLGVITKKTPSGYTGYMGDTDYIENDGKPIDIDFWNTRIAKPQNIIKLDDASVMSMGLADVMSQLKGAIDNGPAENYIEIKCVIPI